MKENMKLIFCFIFMTCIVCNADVGPTTQAIEKDTATKVVASATDTAGITKENMPTKSSTTLTSSIETTVSQKINLCSQNFGKCVNEKDNAACTLTSAVLKGICEDPHMICCVDNQEVQKSWIERDGECSLVFGNCQLQTDKCKGSMTDTAKCAGPSQRKCCAPDEDEMKQWQKNDTACLELMGECQMTKLNCNGRYENDKCGGPHTRQCCLPSADEKLSWNQHDRACRDKWGICQPSVHECANGDFEIGNCGGPKTRQCCVPRKEVVDKWPGMDGECTKQYGKCQHAEESCNGTAMPDLCKGPKHRVCCKPGENVVKSWTENDSPCVTAKGICQHFTIAKCDGSYSSLTCGGPEERKCCINHEQNQHKSTAAKGSSGSSRLKTRIALLIACGVVLLILFVALAVLVAKKRLSRPYKRVREDSWYEKNGTDERVKLTACDEKGTYA